MSKTKLCLLIAFYQRPHITRIVMRHYQRMATMRGDLSLVAVGSEGSVSRSLAEEHGWIYVEAPNRPLSDKLTYGMMRCHKENPEVGIVAMGSDDLVTEPWIERCSKETDHRLGLKDMFLLNTKTWDSLHWPGYIGAREGESIGAHRFFPRQLLDRMEWMIWPLNVNNNLDSHMHRWLSFNSQSTDKYQVLSMERAGCAALGLASETCLTPWHLRTKGSIPVNHEYVFSMFPNETVTDIVNLIN